MLSSRRENLLTHVASELLTQLADETTLRTPWQTPKHHTTPGETHQRDE
jgi:hypothetical protein